MLISLPNAVLHVIQKLNSAGFEAFAVGGCVRDSLLGKSPFDWDITTSASPTETQAVFADHRTLATGIQHGTVTVLIEDTPLEVTTYRIDGTYSDGRHPDTVSFTTTLEEDLRRRDFTINAMAYHPDCGVVDPFGGREDLQRQTIRCVGIPTERFSEDALRILRALRFASVLGFSIEAETATALQQLSHTLQKVSAERIHTESQKLLCGTYAEEIYKSYSPVLQVILPELNTCTECHLLNTTKPIFRSRLAALFYAADVSVGAATSALRRLRADNKTISDISKILTAPPPDANASDANLLRLLNQLGSELMIDYLAIHECDEKIDQRVQRLLSEQACYHVSMLKIDGNDVIAAGVSPGPKVGQVLNDLLYAVMDGLCQNEKEALFNYIQKIGKPVQ